MDDQPTFPREGCDENDVNAWLTDHERRMADALDCLDLSVTVDVEVRLHEDRVKYRETGRWPRGTRGGVERLPNQHARELAASNLLNDRFRAVCSASSMLALIAALRKENHELKRAQP